MKHLTNTPEMQRLIPMMSQSGQGRFIYGCALDHSFPRYLLWPCRDQGEYWLADTMTDDHLLLSTKTYFWPLGLHHFYDAFSLDGRANLRKDAPAQFQFEEEELTSDLRLTPAAVLRKQWGQHQAQLKAPSARSARRDRVPQGVIAQNKVRRKKGSWRRRQASPVLILQRASNNARTPLTEDIHQHSFFVAHTVRARGSDGFQNVLWSVNYSQVCKFHMFHQVLGAPGFQFPEWCFPFPRFYFPGFGFSVPVVFPVPVGVFSSHQLLITIQSDSSCIGFGADMININTMCMA